MSPKFAATAVTLAAAIGSAAPPQPPEFRHAVARRGCTQEDARALEVYLTRARYEGEGEPAPPYARMEIAWDAWARAGGEALELVPLARRDADRRKPIVRAALSAGPGATEWLRGTVRLDRVEVDRRVAGSYEFAGRNGRRWSGTFSARWIASHGGCG